MSRGPLDTSHLVPEQPLDVVAWVTVRLHQNGMVSTSGTIGDKPMVKAVDMTADIVMEDYGLTNLQDNIRQGDMVAPKLPAPQQRMADGFFGGKAMQEQNGKSAGARQAELIRARALSGRYRGMAINPGVASFGRPEGQSPLQVVRTEPIQKPR